MLIFNKLYSLDLNLLETLAMYICVHINKRKHFCGILDTINLVLPFNKPFVFICHSSILVAILFIKFPCVRFLPTSRTGRCVYYLISIAKYEFKISAIGESKTSALIRAVALGIGNISSNLCCVLAYKK